MHMESALTDIDGKMGRDVKEVYVGPSALWIAKLIPRQVSFSQGWFWTTTEICHEGRSDGLAFRQRPDGNGIDVRCHTRGCSRDVAMARLETATGLSIQNAYAPTGRPVDRLWGLKHWPWERLAWWGTAALVFAAPLLVGHAVQAAILACPRVQRRLVADGSVAAATPCQEVLALTAGASGLDHNPLKARVGSSTGSALLLCPQAGAIGKVTKQRHLRRCMMTTATVATGNRTMATVVSPGAAWRSWWTNSSRRWGSRMRRKRRSRARRGVSTRLDDSGRRGRLSTGRWRSSPAWTWRRRRLAGCGRKVRRSAAVYGASTVSAAFGM